MDVNWPTNWNIKKIDDRQSLVDRIRLARGWSKAEWQRNIKLDFKESFLDPWLLPDMKPAVERLQAALVRQEQVCVYGDYDADGIPGAALLLRSLDLAGYEKLLCIIPTRDEGYGLRKQRIDWLAEQGVTLIVTVDTGITAMAEVSYAEEKDIDVIITDHHEPIDGLPHCIAVIDPKRTDSRYQNVSLVGTAVAYKLLWALYEKLSISHTLLKWQLDLVAIATIADLMELNQENRTLVHFGLKVLRRSRNRGLAALMRVAGINIDQVDTGQISFGIAPRLNAPSRLARERHEIQQRVVENIVLTLLTTNDDQQALEAAALINQLNLHRQNNIQVLVEQALAQKAVPEGGGVYLLPDAPVGLVGLVAGRLSELSGWPVLVMAQINGSVRGSARASTKLSIIDLLRQHAELLDQFGGHKQAAGFSVKPKKERQFIKEVEASLQAAAKAFPAEKQIVLDTILRPGEGTLTTAQEIAQLAPFGFGNPKPKLAMTAPVSEVRRLGQAGQHLRLGFGSDYPAAIWFNATEAPLVGQTIMAVTSLEVNNYYRAEPQLNIIELIKQ